MKNKIPHSSSPSNQEIMDSYDFLANSASTQDWHRSDSFGSGEWGWVNVLWDGLPLSAAPDQKSQKGTRRQETSVNRLQKSHKVISDLRDFCCFIFQLLLQHILLLQDFRMIHVPSVHLHLPGYLPEAQNSLSRKWGLISRYPDRNNVLR